MIIIWGFCLYISTESLRTRGNFACYFLNPESVHHQPQLLVVSCWSQRILFHHPTPVIPVTYQGSEFFSKVFCCKTAIQVAEGCLWCGRVRVRSLPDWVPFRFSFDVSACKWGAKEGPRMACTQAVFLKACHSLNYTQAFPSAPRVIVTMLRC